MKTTQVAVDLAKSVFETGRDERRGGTWERFLVADPRGRLAGRGRSHKLAEMATIVRLAALRVGRSHSRGQGDARVCESTTVSA
jgi:hypothetical protein